MRINKKIVIEKFNKFNKKIFENKLTIPHEIEIEYMDTELGAYIPFDLDQPNDLLLLTDEYSNTEEFDSTLLHEMIHCWQWQQLKNSGCGHDQVFKTWVDLISKHGYEVEIVNED